MMTQDSDDDDQVKEQAARYLAAFNSALNNELARGTNSALAAALAALAALAAHPPARIFNR